MLDRLKRVLVKSFIGAIGLGYLLAQAVMYMVSIFTSPLTQWSTQSIFQSIAPRPSAPAGFPFQAALPQIVGFLVLLLIWYGLLRWLYFTRLTESPSGPTPNPDEAA